MKHLTSPASHLVLAALGVCAIGLYLAGTLGALLGGMLGGALCWLVPLADAKTDIRSIPDACPRERRTSGEVIVAKVSGPLTFLAQGSILPRLDGAPWPRVLVLDLTAVPMMDAGGVTEIADVVEFMAARDTRVLVAAPRHFHERLRVGAPVLANVEDAIGCADGAAHANDASAPAFVARAAGWS